MILVIEAGYHGAVAFSACSTLPVSTSTRICDSAAARDAARLTVMLVASARISVRPMVDSCKNITTQSAFGWPQNHVPHRGRRPYLTTAACKCKMELRQCTGSRLQKNVQ